MMIHRCIGGELLLFGGNANNGSNCGLVYANSNNGWSNSNSNIGARTTSVRVRIDSGAHISGRGIVYIPEPDHREPCPLMRMYSQDGQNNSTLRGTAQATATVLVGFSRKFQHKKMQG